MIAPHVAFGSNSTKLILSTTGPLLTLSPTCERTFISVAMGHKQSSGQVDCFLIRRVRAANAESGGGYVVRLSDEPTPGERLQLIAAHLERRPIVIMPHKCASGGEWLEQYGSMDDG